MLRLPACLHAAAVYPLPPGASLVSHSFDRCFAGDQPSFTDGVWQLRLAAMMNGLVNAEGWITLSASSGSLQQKVAVCGASIAAMATFHHLAEEAVGIGRSDYSWSGRLAEETNKPAGYVGLGNAHRSWDADPDDESKLVLELGARLQVQVVPLCRCCRPCMGHMRALPCCP